MTLYLHLIGLRGGFTRVVCSDKEQGRIQDFPKESANPKRGRRQPVIWPNFPENMKIKKKWTEGGAHQKFYYVDPPLKRIYFRGLNSLIMDSS